MIIVLLVLVPSILAFDGCGGNGLWRCGDVCIGDNSPCHCGNETTFFQVKNSSKTHLTWCCTNTTCQGLGDKEVRWEFKGAYLKGANCSSGSVLNLTQACPNDLPSTRGTTSQKRDGIGGTATESCNDYDVPGVGISVDPDIGLRSYTPCWTPGQNISECIKKSFEGDGKYHCKSRSDENPFPNTSGVTTAVVDPTSLMTACQDFKNKSGLLCPGRGCLRFDHWCQVTTIGKDGATEGPRKCGLPGQPQFMSNDKKVCSHPTFWRDKAGTCTEYRWI